MDENKNPKQEQPDKLTRKMSQWQEANSDATLTEMEEAVEAELAKLLKRLVEEMVAEKETATQEVPDCPQCGESMVKNGQRQRQRKLKSKEGQTLQLNRQQWRCLACGATLFPPG